MNLHLLKDSDLISKTKSLAKEEIHILQSILAYLAEIERRRLFAARGFSSLFEFCVHELHYPESAAHRRISSTRLIKALPEAGEKLNSGEVNLSTLSQLQGFIHREEETKKVKLSHDAKLDLLKVIENKSSRECEREFIKISPESIKARESIRPKTEDLVEIKFLASKNLESKLLELQNLLAHQNKTHSISELIEILADLALKNKALNPQRTQPVPKRTSAAEVRKQVFRRDQNQCQFVDPLTKRKCLSRFKIQIDHVHPKALGGEETLENLRLLCATHNQYQAIKAFSPRHMKKFIPSLE